MAMSKKKTIIFIMFIIIGIFIAYVLYNYPYKEIDISDKMELLNNSEEISLNDLNKNDWDSVLILAPYNTSGIDGIDLSDKYRKKIKANINNDGYCTFLFLKHNELVNYSFIPRISNKDFTKYNNLYFNKKTKLCKDSIGMIQLIK